MDQNEVKEILIFSLSKSDVRSLEEGPNFAVQYWNVVVEVKLSVLTRCPKDVMQLYPIENGLLEKRSLGLHHTLMRTTSPNIFMRCPN